MAALLNLGNVPNRPDFPDETLWDARDQTTLWTMRA